MARLADVATVLSVVSPKPTGGRAAKFVQIKDLSVEKRSLVLAPSPAEKRATPIKANDVLVAARGERVYAGRPDDELIGAFASLDLYLLRPDSRRVDPDYLAAFLNLPTVAAQLRAAATGTNPPRIPKEALSELDVPLPPLEHQVLLGQLAVATAMYRALFLRRLAVENHLLDSRLEAAFDCLQKGRMNAPSTS